MHTPTPAQPSQPAPLDHQTALAATVAAMHRAFGLGRKYAAAVESWDAGLAYCDTDAQRAAHVARCERVLAAWEASRG